jgi:hypothetical protein
MKTQGMTPEEVEAVLACTGLEIPEREKGVEVLER